MKNNLKQITLLTIYTITAMILVTSVSAGMKLDSLQFDPAIIASGDTVDIIIQFHSEGSFSNDNMVGNPDYTYEINLEPDDTVSEKYITIMDSQGNDLNRAIYNNDRYNKVFRIKVNNDAPAGDYELKLTGRWYLKGEPIDAVEYQRFTIPVKKEGIILGVSSLETDPREVRPGDNYVKVITTIENAGEKDAKSVTVDLDTPEGLSSSYTDDNRLWIGSIKAGESKTVTFNIDVGQKILPQRYDLDYNLEFMDLDNNRYKDTGTLPFLIKERPYLEISSFKGEGLAGKSSKLYIKVKNTGTESAESVDVRILKANSQPFELDVRSDYIGELEPGETGTAVFDIKVNPDAEIKTHDLKVLLRSKGDSDEGDENIYTYNRRTKFDVIGIAPNKMRAYGIAAAAIVVFLSAVNMIFKKVSVKPTKR